MVDCVGPAAFWCASVTHRGAHVVLSRGCSLAFTLVQHVRANAIAQVVQVHPVAGMPGLAIPVDPAGAGRIRDAELVGMEQKRVGICDIQLLLLPHQPALLARDRLHQSLAKRRRQIIVLLRRKMVPKRILASKPVEVTFMPVLHY